MDMDKEIILVDSHDNITGYTSKFEAHRTGALHRAFSVFLYHENSLLIQQRAQDKYHSGGLWANTCCSHPRKGESLEAAVSRRLMEEAGIKCGVEEVFAFVYKHQFGEQLYEHEYDHVFLGEYDGEYVMNPDEVQDFRWVDLDELKTELESSPEKFACWFQIAAPKVIEIIQKRG